MDKYDKGIEELVESGSTNDAPDHWRYLRDVWGAATNPLFQYACMDSRHAPQGVGCLTMIRGGYGFRAETPELTEAILADKRIPMNIDNLLNLRGDELRAALQPFAEWQRRLDKELGRTVEV